MRWFIFNDVINCKGRESCKRFRRRDASFVTDTEYELKLKATYGTTHHFHKKRTLTFMVSRKHAAKPLDGSKSSLLVDICNTRRVSPIRRQPLDNRSWDLMNWVLCTSVEGGQHCYRMFGIPEELPLRHQSWDIRMQNIMPMDFWLNLLEYQTSWLYVADFVNVTF